MCVCVCVGVRHWPFVDCWGLSCESRRFGHTGVMAEGQVTTGLDIGV